MVGGGAGRPGDGTIQAQGASITALLRPRTALNRKISQMTREAWIPICTADGKERALRRVIGLLVVMLAISFGSRTFAQTQPENGLVRALSHVPDSTARISEQRLPRGEHLRSGAVLGVLRSEQGTPLGGSRVFLWATPLLKPGLCTVPDVALRG